MTLALTPQMVAAAYEYLRTTAPFKGWRLPHADAVQFHITRHRDIDGDHTIEEGEHRIRVSTSKVKTTLNLMQVLAHEMCHEYQDGVLGTGSDRVFHNTEFWKLSQRVCRLHGWEEVYS